MRAGDGIEQLPWQDIRDDLRGCVGEERYNLWLSFLEPLSYEEGCLKIGVPNRFIQEWVEGHYADAVRDTIKKRLGVDTDVVFTISGALFREFHKEQHPASSPERVPPSGSEALPAGLNRDYTLGAFVVGPANELAYNAVLQVLRTPGRLFNPLFLCGDTGLGKSHLLQAVAQAYLEKRRDCRVRYLTGAQFTSEFCSSIRQKATADFRGRYRNLHALIVDDVYLLVNKKKTQEEFLHTFNALANDGRQILLASNCHPRGIQELQENLVGRFMSGLVVRINRPDYETRLRILRAAANKTPRPLPDDVLQYIAERFDENVRELTGAFNRVNAYGCLDCRRMDVPRAARMLAEMVAARKKKTRLDEILAVVAGFHGVDPGAVLSPSRRSTVKTARQSAIYLARECTVHSLVEIGRYFGGRNQSTVKASIARVRDLMRSDRRAKNAIEELRRRLTRR